MAKLLGSLISSFLLLRDLFGYLIPGAVFIGMMMASFKIGDIVARLLPPLSQWLWLGAFLVVSYAVGQILVALGYGAHDLVRKLFVPSPKPAVNDKNGKNGKKGAGKEAAPADHGVTDTEYLFYRHLYPQLFVDADRREIVTILRIGLGVALVFGPWSLPVPGWISPVIAVVGAFMLYNGGGARAHTAAFRAASVAAAKLVERKGVPYFAWGGAPAAGED
jgi:hypothetical protein